MNRSHGTTLLETVISLSLLGLLMLLMFSVYRLGANAWKSGETDAQLAQSAQIVTDRLAKEASRSALVSLALDPIGPPSSAVSFLSPVNPATSLPDYDGTVGSPVWHSHSICYFDSTQGEIRWRSIPLAMPTTSAAPLATLAAERNNGILLSKEVTECEFLQMDRTIEVFIAVERKRYGKETPDRMELRSSVCFRN